MKILISKDNRDALEKALKTVQTGRARNDIDVDALIDTIAPASEGWLERKGIVRGRRVGAKNVFAEAGASTKAYKWGIDTTQVTTLRGGKGWYLIGVDRIRQYPKAPRVDRYILTDDQIDAVQQHSMRNVERAKAA